MRIRIMILFLVVVPVCTGCIHRSIPGTFGRSGADTETAAASGPEIRTDGWLSPIPGRSDSTVHTDAHMIRAALSDTLHSWLQASIDLLKGASIRIEGPGALAVHLRIDGRKVIHRDTGLFVPIQSDASAFLNSSTGPISIRYYHDQGLAGQGIRILLRLPHLDLDKTEIIRIKPVPDLWTYHP